MVNALVISTVILIARVGAAGARCDGERSCLQEVPSVP